MTARPLRIAVIGAGFFGSTLARAAADHAALEVVLVCDRDGEAAARLAKDVGGTPTTDLAEVERSAEVELAMVATPNHLHAEQVMRLLQAGKHVFVEKPLTIDAEDARAMVVTAAEHQRLLLVGHVLRTLPGVKRAHAMASSGQLGQLLEAYGVRSRVVHVPDGVTDWWKLDSARSGGEMLHELHELDLICWFLGEPDRVEAVAGAPLPLGTGSADTVHLTTLGFRSGAVGHHELSTSAHASAWGFRIGGTEAAIEVDFKTSRVRRFEDGRVTDSWDVFDATAANESLRESAEKRQAYHSHNDAAATTPLWMATAVRHELDEVVSHLREGAGVLADLPAAAVLAGLAALDRVRSTAGPAQADATVDAGGGR
ncbi:Gfo/Idh/MocA family protein [Kribbella catacumbae]|uniref:Gfo/Idh/MocA family protein n=1 Tax=Kribbella catacumbae TaxID=460086 RepID=UPI00038094E0|nr:Gfo/Idh/MocA family oxidoreductase [Kribbella catacumbae]